jgi:hypothetical protein
MNKSTDDISASVIYWRDLKAQFCRTSATLMSRNLTLHLYATIDALGSWIQKCRNLKEAEYRYNFDIIRLVLIRAIER